MKMKNLILLFVLTLMTGTTLAVDEEKPAYDVEQLRMELKDFDRASGALYYANEAYGQEVDSNLIYQLHPLLWQDAGPIKLVDEELKKTTEPRRIQILKNLRRALSELWIWKKVSAIDDEILNAEATMMVKVGDKEYSYRDLGLVSYNEKDAGKRKEYYFAGLSVVRDQLNPMYWKKVQALGNAAKELGYANFAAFVAEMHGYDYKNWDKNCRLILESVKDINQKLNLEQMNKVFPGRDPKTVMPWHSDEIFRHLEYDEFFPKEGMMENFNRVMMGMGIDMKDYPNIWVDTEDRENKVPRPATFTIAPPIDIRVNIKLWGGPTDYASVYHEMGHALHYGCVKVPEYELQMYGDGGLTESYAFLLEGLLYNPLFLEEEVGLPKDKAREWARISLASELGGLRYYCRNFLFEEYMHSDKTNPKSYYESLYKKDHIFAWLPESVEYGYMLTDEQFYGLYYLEAWLTSSVMNEYLEKTYGERWWKDKRVGEWLKSLWARGEEITCAELCAQMGEKEFGPKTLLKRLKIREEQTR